jgi:uncharacterized protein
LDSSTQTRRTTVVRSRERGRYDRETINAIVDEALICHVGFSVDGQPYVIPTIHVRIGDDLFIHGSVGSRMLKSKVTDEQEKRVAFDALVNHVVPGRSADVRPANAQELKATSVLRLPIAEASAKVRHGPPIDAQEDYALKCWAGVLPMQLVPGDPIDDPRLELGTPVPAAVATYRHQRGRSDID